MRKVHQSAPVTRMAPELLQQVFGDDVAVSSRELKQVQHFHVRRLGTESQRDVDCPGNVQRNIHRAQMQQLLRGLRNQKVLEFLLGCGQP